MKGLLKTIILIVYVTTTLSSPHLHKHVLEQIRLGQDTASSSVKRVYEIYSKATGGRVQVQGKKVDANGIPGDMHARLEISSVSFGSRITIRSVATGRYLCMSKKGRLMAKIKRISSRCHFIEKIGENYFDTFRNVRRSKWFLAFHQNGRPKRGPRTSSGQAEVMFLKLPVQQEVAATNPAPSGPKEKALAGFQKTIRMTYLNRREAHSGESDNTRMMQDDPGVIDNPLIVPTDPPEIKKEIEIRRNRALQNISQSKFAYLSNDVIVASSSAPQTIFVKESSDKLKTQKQNTKRKQRRNKKRIKSIKSLINSLTEDNDVHSSVKQGHDQRKTLSPSKSDSSSNRTMRKAAVSPTLPSMLEAGQTSSQRHLYSRRIRRKKFRKHKKNYLSSPLTATRDVT